MKSYSLCSHVTILLRAMCPLLLVLSPLAVLSATPESSSRERIRLTENWRFQKGDPAGEGQALDYATLKPWLLPTAHAFVSGGGARRPEGEEPGSRMSYVQPRFDDASWRQLDLPHDWGIEGPFNQELPGETAKLPWFGVAWYRKSFDLPASDKDRRIFLEIEGAMSYSAVWCNGQLVGGWPYGYSSYSLDLTPYIKAGGRNTLAIRLDNPADSSRWYPGGGLYRDVWLVKTGPVRIAPCGVAITTPVVGKDSATIALRVGLDLPPHAAGKSEIRTEIMECQPGDTAGPVVASAVAEVDLAKAEPVEMSTRLSHPKLWNLECPSLYLARTTIGQGGRIIDQTDMVFGMRTAEFTVNDGFHLNGKRVQIHGVCMHHDLGALGAAFNVRAAQRQLEILKEMGANAIRTSHNPPAPELLDLCDRMGFLVMDEAFDCWQRQKKKNDYHGLFPDWAEADIRALVRRDRHHPSVVLWSVGNEISEQSRPEGPALAKQLAQFIRMEDSTRPITAGAHQVAAGYNGFQKAMDVFGYNYKPQEYAKFRRANPALPLVGSETASTISTRGEYVFPVITNDATCFRNGVWNGGCQDFQISSYDFSFPRWATLADTEFRAQEANPFVAGEFVWTGFDYLGEPTPYNADTSLLLNYSTPEARAKAEEDIKRQGKVRTPSRSSYFGIVDLAGFRKDRFYLYQSHWRPDFPMAHLLPHWTWPGREGQETPVYVYTSGDEAELFLNGRSLGRRKKETGEYRLHWDEVKYEPGLLKVVTYRKGQVWAEDSMRTAGPAVKLSVVADRSAIQAGGRDLAYVTVRVEDAGGQLVPRAKIPLRFSLSGPGVLRATDNGDATDHTIFASPERQAFNGLALAIVASQKDAGEITLHVSAEGVMPAEVKIQSVNLKSGVK